MVKTAAKANAVWTGDYCDNKMRRSTNSHPAGLPPTSRHSVGTSMKRRLLLQPPWLFAASTAPAFAHLDPAEHGSLMRRLHPSALRPRPYSGHGRRRPLGGTDWRRGAVGRSGGLRRHDGLRLRTGNGRHRTCPSSSRQSSPRLSRSACWSPWRRVCETTACAAIVGVFALFHGYAHGGELGAAGALPFGTGFMIATALLHVAGIGLGLGVGRLSSGRVLSRLLGGLTALAGLALIFN